MTLRPHAIARLALCAALGVGLACATPPPGGIYYTTGDRSLSPDGLHRVEWEPFTASYVRPGASLKRFNQVLVQAPEVNYASPPRPAPMSLTNRRPVDANYALSEQSLEAMERIFREEFEKAFASSKEFSLAQAPGPDVLLLAGHIADLKITVPPERFRSSDDRIYAVSPGQMTLIVELKDSETGESLLRVGQRRHIEMPGKGLYQVDPVSSSNSLRQIFQRWAGDLRRELEQFHALAELPPAP